MRYPLSLISGSSHKKFLKAMRKIFAVTAIIICSRAGAQQSGDTLDVVTLTTNKYSTKTTETGKVVTIISRQDIERAGSRDLSQLITEKGGVFINGFNSNPGKEKNIYLRGAKVDYTLITIDGIPVYDASGIGSNFDIRNLSIDNVDRIEILKGSQSTLYGSDAIAGVINIITKKGGTKPFGIGGVVHAGSFNSLRAGLNINGQRGRFSYNLGGTRFSTDGFSEAKPLNGSPFEKDGYKENTASANFDIRFPGTGTNHELMASPFFRYSWFKGDIDLDAFTDEKDFSNENKNLQAGIKNKWQLGKAQVNVLYQYVRTNRNYLDDSGYVSNSPAVYYKYNRQHYLSNEHFAEAFLVYPFTNFKLTAGADARFSNTGYDAVQLTVFSPVADRPAYSGDSVKQHQFGIYAALNFSWKDLTLEAGGRMNNHSAYGNNFAFNINPSYFAEKRLKLFANVSSGYKTPSLYQLFSLYGNKALDPENSLNLEGGVQVFSKDEKSSVRAVYFHRNVKDVITFAPLPAFPYAQYINQDKQKDQGFEVEASASITNIIQLKAQYSYVDGKITTRQGGKDTTLFNLLRRPKSTLNFSSGMQVTKALYMNAQLNFVGKRKDIYFDPSTFQSQDITLPHYILLNFYAEYALLQNRLKLFVDGRNLTDKNYSDIYGYNTAGFNAYGGLRFNF